MKRLLIALFVFINTMAYAQRVPTFEDVISLRSPSSVTLSGDGLNTAFTVQTTDWKDNYFDTEIWLSKNKQTPFQLTNTPKGISTNPSFSPDGQWLAFLSNRGNKTQIHVINLNGGEAKAVTSEEENITNFNWHPSGKKFVFIKPEKESAEKKEIEKRYGGFEIDDKDYTLSHLWQIDFKPELQDPSAYPCYTTIDSLKAEAGCIEFPKSMRLTEGKFTVTKFVVSPDGKKIAFSHQPNPDIISLLKSDVSLYNFSDEKTIPLVNNTSIDQLQDWSPDSKELLYTTNLTDTLSNFYINPKLFIIEIESKKTRQLAASLDEFVEKLTWVKSGIYAPVWHRTKRPIYKIDPSTGNHIEWLISPEQISDLSFSKDGDQVAVIGRNGDELTEIFKTPTDKILVEKLSDFSAQIRDWKVAQSEVISWKSKDGETIEGVLHKPKDYDPNKKYPLLVVIHGGPTAIDTPSPIPGGVYPVVQWLDKGALVLRVNYRGSAGYGERFRSLNVKNLGIGDAWDVLSGVEYLDKKGMIDKTKMGSMGWSQGGYISAFLTTNTDIFKAISVGAGISNWMTYYVNTDIHAFTRQYLKATPWSDELIYKKTSPMTNINKAKTPTLIQHGEFDKRVPIASAYELLQGLRDKGVPSELIIYKGFGHGITKPKERLAANWHNWQWFNKYIWNEEVKLPLK